MLLKHLKTLIPAQNGAAKITVMTWSHNSLKLAVCTADRVVVLFDENGEKRDKFSTKPIDSKYGKKSYVVKGMAFSPDGTKLAVGQSDHIVFVYRIGEEWGEKKVICNKFVQTSAVTRLIWPLEGPIVYGLADGKVRGANVKTGKSHTFYQADSYVVALSANSSGTGFISGHADGSVVRYYVVKSERMLSQGVVLRHPVPPFALCWVGQHIAVGGCDTRVVFYNGVDGRLCQQFDYTRDESEKEFCCAANSPSGQSVVLGSFDRLRVYDWSPQRGAWHECASCNMPHMYTIGGVAWRRDGSRLVCSGLCGAVQLFDSAIKRTVWNNSWEVTYVGPSQVLIKPIKEGGRGVILKSQFGHEIMDVKFMGGDNYLVARTPETLLLADLTRNLLSEVSWMDGDRKEKFFFENATCCVVFSGGELYLVEYGNNEVMCSVRTQFRSPHLLSIRINERHQRNTPADNKKMAFLVDAKTIVVVDLLYGVNVAVFSHDTRLDWLELNETSTRLLFRDKRLRLALADVESKSTRLLASDCSFVQWVPGSDVVVAQSQQNMLIWYDIDAPDRVFTVPLKGDIVTVDRTDKRAEVLVQDARQEYTYKLDEGLIEFGTAVDDGDLVRAMSYLESLPDSSSLEAENMWRTLARLALESQQLDIADRCYAALGDVSKCRFLRQLIELMNNEGLDSTLAEGQPSVEVRARLALLNGRLKEAEQVYVANSHPQAAINMYKNMMQWEHALEVAKNFSPADWPSLKTEYFNWLMSTNQVARAAEVCHQQGELVRAVDMYLSCGMPARAAHVAMSSTECSSDQEVLDKIARALINADLHEQCGELYVHSGRLKDAMKCFRKAGSFSRAVALARSDFPDLVVELEEQWGEDLLSKSEPDSAISHFIEAGRSVKALEAAVHARQWKKAVEIAEACSGDPAVQPFLLQISEHAQQTGDLSAARKLLVDAGNYSDAVEMFCNAGLWSQAHQLAVDHMSSEEVARIFMQVASQLEAEGKHQDAEKVHVMIGEPDLAITMYKKLGLFDAMMRLVAEYHPELVSQTHLHLARELEAGGRHSDAEKHYVLGGEWKAAVNMWRVRDHWEEAFRVAQNSGDSAVCTQVAYLWSRNIGGHGAIKLLSKLNLLSEAVDVACDSGHFDFAYELAPHCSTDRDKLAEVRYKHALALEDGGKWADAERAFVAAGKAREAVLMHVHAGRWSEASRVAQAHHPATLPDVLEAQARHVFQQQADYAQFEALLLRAGRSEVAVTVYKEADMWSEALRVCRDYAPHRLPQLEREYDSSLLRHASSPERRKSSTAGVSQSEVSSPDIHALMERGAGWQRADNMSRAVDCYMQVQASASCDVDLLRRAWTTAARLAIKFLEPARAAAVSSEAGARLTAVGEHQAAAEVFLAARLVEEAVTALEHAGDWSRARKVAGELAPALLTSLDERYTSQLTRDGNVDVLASVDVSRALDLMVSQHQWQRCLDLAASQAPSLLMQYVGQYADHLLASDQEHAAVEALRLYVKHGAPVSGECQRRYSRIAVAILGLPMTLNDEDDEDTSQDTISAAAVIRYKQCAELRDFLADVSDKLDEKKSRALLSSNSLDADINSSSLSLLVQVAHLMSARACYLSQPQLAQLAVRASLSLLRHIDLLPADVALYEAGAVCRRVPNCNNTAFVLWNWCLDVCDALDDSTGADGLRGSVITAADQLLLTDIPLDAPLPPRRALNQRQLDSAKQWLLAASMDQNTSARVQPKLPLDERGVFVASLRGDEASNTSAPSCVVTGFPVISDGGGCVQFQLGRVANRDDWNTLLMASKMSPSAELSDLVKFIGRWAGRGQQGFAFS